MEHLKQFVERENAWARLMRIPPLSINSPKDRKAIRERLEAELSPENLTCDGELSDAAVKAKYRLLTAALNELNERDSV